MDFNNNKDSDYNNNVLVGAIISTSTNTETYVSIVETTVKSDPHRTKPLTIRCVAKKSNLKPKIFKNYNIREEVVPYPGSNYFAWPPLGKMSGDQPQSHLKQNIITFRECRHRSSTISPSVECKLFHKYNSSNWTMLVVIKWKTTTKTWSCIGNFGRGLGLAKY